MHVSVDIILRKKYNSIIKTLMRQGKKGEPDGAIHTNAAKEKAGELAAD